jgi:hypothetical protein
MSMTTARPAALHDRVDEQPEDVDQAGGQQRPHEARAAGDDDVPARGTLQRRQLVLDGAPQDRRVRPVRALHAGGEDVLRDLIEIPADPGRVVDLGRPVARELLVGDAAEYQRVRGLAVFSARGHQVLVLRAGVEPAIHGRYDPVEADVLRYDKIPHFFCIPRRTRRRPYLV